MIHVPDDFDRMVKKAILLMNKGFFDKAAPLVFKIDDIIVNSSNTLTYKKFSNALGPLIRFYFTEVVDKGYPDKFNSFIERLPEYIRTYRNVFEDVLKRPAKSNHENFLYALAHLHLGRFYDSIELNDNAKSNYNKAIDLLMISKGDNSEVMATVLCNLGLTCAKQDNETEAITLWNKAYDIQKAMNRQYSICTAQILTYLSSYADREKANTYLKEAVKIRRRVLPTESPEHSESFMTIAGILDSKGETARAITYYKKALLCQHRKTPVDHMELFNTLSILSLLYIKGGSYRMAYRHFMSAQTEETRWINQKVWVLNDDDRSKFLEEAFIYLKLFINYVIVFMVNKKKTVKAAYDIYLSRKGLLLETQNGFQEALMSNAPAEVRLIIEKLNKIRSRISSAYHIADHKIQQTREDYAELERKKKALEEELRRAYEPYDLEKIVTRARVDEIVNCLPPNSALVEFAKIEAYDFEKEAFGNSNYYAFIVSKGRSCKVVLKDLGESEYIDAAINRLRKSIVFLKVSGHKYFAKDESKTIKELSKKLHDSIFLQIAEHIGKKKRLFICPDGDLNLLPLEILVDSEANYLIEKYTFNYLTSGRDLLRQGLKKNQSEENHRGKIVLMGNPDFGLSLKRSKPKESKMRDYSIRLSPLPNTEQEISKISGLFREDETLVYTGKDASEEVLRSIKSPPMLHLATHGIFLPMSNVNKAKLSGDRNIEGNKKEIIAGLGNPLLCSGIALAGFNMAANSNGLNDGVLTAEEVLNLNLSGTELVTLSACETGMGKIGLGQGVFGLRSAFARAGAAAMVLSLWKVPDEETKDLMVYFYGNMVKRGINKNEALRKAALTVMKEMKKKHGHTHPRFWGGFIFSGASN